MPLIDIFKKLNGVWNFKRTITNNKFGEYSGVAVGTATFDLRTEHIYECREAGVFSTATQKTLAVSKEYLYEYDASKEDIIVHSAAHMQSTAEVFHLKSPTEKPDKTICFSQHRCPRTKGDGVDVYDATYEFSTDAVTITIKVEGPEKDYVSHTILSREPVI